MSSLAVLAADTARFSVTIDKAYRLAEKRLRDIRAVTKKISSESSAAIEKSIKQIQAEQQKLRTLFEINMSALQNSALSPLNATEAANGAKGAESGQEEKKKKEKIGDVVRKVVADTAAAAIVGGISSFVSAAFSTEKDKKDKKDKNSPPSTPDAAAGAADASEENKKQKYSGAALMEAIGAAAKKAAQNAEAALATYFFKPTKENLKTLKKTLAETANTFLKDSLTAWGNDLKEQLKLWFEDRKGAFANLFKKDKSKDKATGESETGSEEKKEQGENPLSFSEKMGDFLTDSFKGLREVAESIFDNMGTLGEGIGKMLGSLTDGIGNIIGSIGGGIGSMGSGIGNLFSSFFSFFGGARAHGGPVTQGKTYLVGEHGPELFTASNNGRIIPNESLNQAAIAPAQASQVNVRVVNAFDNGVIDDYLGSNSAEHRIMNIVRRNASTVRQLSGGA